MVIDTRKTAFVPRTRSELAEPIKKALLEGYVIRCNSISTDPIEILYRGIITCLGETGNIGQLNPNQKKYYLVKEIKDLSFELVSQVIRELDEKYFVKKVSCTNSGVCQYHTVGYYLL